MAAKDALSFLDTRQPQEVQGVFSGPAYSLWPAWPALMMETAGFSAADKATLPYAS